VLGFISYVLFSFTILGWCVFVIWFGFFLLFKTRKSLREGEVKTTQYSIDRSKNPMVFLFFFGLSWGVYLGMLLAALLMLPQAIEVLLKVFVGQV
jgi:fumarate reductase subunit C